MHSVSLKFLVGILSFSDYYAFGMQMVGRNGGEDYRYAFNGMEHDPEVSGDGNSYTTEFRAYDPRLGRWKSLDPLMAKFPHSSPYVGFANNPIYFTDPYGLEPDKGGGGADALKSAASAVVGGDPNNSVSRAEKRRANRFMRKIERHGGYTSVDTYMDDQGRARVEVTYATFEDPDNIRSEDGSLNLSTMSISVKRFNRVGTYFSNWFDDSYHNRRGNMNGFTFVDGQGTGGAALSSTDKRIQEENILIMGTLAASGGAGVRLNRYKLAGPPPLIKPGGKNFFFFWKYAQGLFGYGHDSTIEVDQPVAEGGKPALEVQQADSIKVHVYEHMEGIGGGYTWKERRLITVSPSDTSEGMVDGQHFQLPN